MVVLSVPLSIYLIVSQSCVLKMDTLYLCYHLVNGVAMPRVPMNE